MRVGDGARLIGSGPRTVITAPGASYFAVLVARGRNIAISNLTVDGGGPGPGRGIAVAVFDGSRNVRLSRLRLTHVRHDGVNVWGAYSNVSVQDSVIEGDGSAQIGVFALGSDRSRDTSVIRTRIRGFRSHGILLAQREYGRPAAALHGLALDNVVSDIRNPARDRCYYAPNTTPKCGTDEGGIWTGGVEAAIIGNTVVRARWDGIETVGSSTRTTVVGNRIRDTRTGIYLEHSTHDSLFARNVVSGARTGINVEWWHDGQGSTRNTFSSNRIVSATQGRPVRRRRERRQPDRRQHLRRRCAAGDRPPGDIRQRRPPEPRLRGRRRGARPRTVGLLRQRRAGPCRRRNRLSVQLDRHVLRPR